MEETKKVGAADGSADGGADGAQMEAGVGKSGRTVFPLSDEFTVCRSGCCSY